MGVTLQWRYDPADRSPRTYGEWVEFGGGIGRCRGYMAHSDRVGPGVVVVPDAFGVHESVIAFCNDLESEGFTALAPDLYDGRLAASEEQARSLSDALEADRAVRKLREAVTFLADNWHPRVGVVGLGDGASLAAQVAERTRIDALVTWGASVEASVPSLSLGTEGDVGDLFEFLAYNLS